MKSMESLDDEVRIGDTEENIRKIVEIHSEFANWARTKFSIFKCAYWGRNFVRGWGEEITFENFTLCRKTIPQLEGSEAFKYLGEYKAPMSAKTNQKPTLPYKPNKNRWEAHEGKKSLC